MKRKTTSPVIRLTKFKWCKNVFKKYSIKVKQFIEKTFSCEVLGYLKLYDTDNL